MAKRKTFKQKISVMLAKKTREWKREAFDTVCKKGKVETVGDIVGIFYGLSRKAVEMAAFRDIQRLASLGFTPAEIVERMSVKSEKKRGNNTDNRVYKTIRGM
jgi:hypothetical protein